MQFMMIKASMRKMLTNLSTSSKFKYRKHETIPIVAVNFIKYDTPQIQSTFKTKKT